MMIRIYTLIIILFSLNVYGQNVSKTEAETAAMSFISAIEPNEYSIDSIYLIKHQNTAIYYIVNFTGNDAFLMLSADKSAYPILGFSLKNQFDLSNIPPNAAEFFENYKSQIYHLKSNNISATNEISEIWNQLLSNNINFSNSKSVAPLLTSIWGQGCYYNDQCPADVGGPCGHAVTGCVATAMGQVINYHKFPPNGSGIHSYNSNYGLLTADFGSTNYDWQNMADTLNQYSDSAEVYAVSELISHCGIAVDMMYSAGSSGAYSEDAANALVHFFNFSEEVKQIHKSNYKDSIWNSIMKTQLDSLQPMYYSGSGSGGHAFVCDGYIADDYFHINWGWNSILDGYFYFNALNPGSMNFSSYQSAIINIKPKMPNVCQGITDTITNHKGNISDGSSYADYQSGLNCSWLIQPNGVNNIDIEFFNFDLNIGDTLFVFDDSTASSNLIDAYHINNQPPTIITSSSNSVFIQFTTDNSHQSSGWAANYKSNYCSVYNSLGLLTDTISDGSGDLLNYNNNTNCFWLISDSLGRQINLEFIEFQTELGFDFVEIYDGNSTNANQLGNFSGNNLPPVLFANSGHMLINFISDGGVVDLGWKALYYICDNSQFEIANNDSISICENQSFSFKNSNYQNLDWFYNGSFISTSDSLIANASGKYFAINSNVSCPDDTSFTVFLNVNQKPQPNLGQDTMICIGMSLQLSTDSLFQTYLWSTGDTTSSLIVDTTGMQNYQKLISLEVTDFNVCSGIDSVLITFMPCIGFEENLSQTEFEFFPNPASKQITIKSDIISENSIIEIYSADAKLLIKQKAKQNNRAIIEIDKLSGGLYFIKIISENTVYTVRFIKE
jgi:hypothetical protein